MKKVFIMLMALTAIISCNKDVTEIDRTMTFEKLASRDYEYMGMQSPAGFYFYEVQCVLNGSPAQMDAEDVKVVKATSIAVTEGDRVFEITTDLATGQQHVEIIVNNRWGGDFAMDDPKNVKITFAEAVKLLKEQKEFEVPDSEFCTFRQPTVGLILHPRYIFGSQSTGFVYVDSDSGEIGQMR